MADFPQLENLISTHKETWKALEAACDVTDAAEPDSPEQEAAEEAQGRASDDTYNALWGIIEHPYASLDELKRGLAYLAEHHRTTGDGDPGQWLKGLAENLVGGVNG